MKTVYEILGVEPTASDDEIRKQFFALVRANHPDKNPSKEAKELTQQIIGAYFVINTPEKRRNYDNGQCITPDLSHVSEELRSSPSLFFYENSRHQSCPGFNSERRKKAKFADECAETFAESAEDPFMSSSSATTQAKEPKQVTSSSTNAMKKMRSQSDDAEDLPFLLTRKLSIHK